MRAGAQRDPGAGKAWPGWLITGAIALAAATVYLCFSITQALQSDVDSPSEPLPVLNAPATSGTASAATHPNPEAKPEDEPKGQEPRPKEPKQRDPKVEEPRGALIPGLGAGAFDPALMAAIKDAVGDDGDHVAVAAKRVTGGRSAALNGDVEYYAAST